MKITKRVGMGILVGLLASCGPGGQAERGIGETIEIDGSSTVFPITEAVAEEFMLETGGSVRVTVALSGTGGGFRRFCAGETDISNASRPMEPSEAEACAANGVEYVALPVGLDGVSVVVNPGNDFVQCLTVEELARIWAPGSTLQRWSEIRPEWPDQVFRLYGPGTNSGTFDYFTEEIGGRTGASRSDYTASEDDNVLVQGIGGDPGGLGYFGFAYYTENQGRVKIVGVDAGDGCVTPTLATIESGTYAPLSRPLYIYVNLDSLGEPAVDSFVRYYLDTAPMLTSQVGYVPLSVEAYEESRAELERVTDAR